MLAFAAAVAVIQRAEHADGGVEAGAYVRHRNAHTHRPVTWLAFAMASDRHHPGHGLDQVVVA
ncbi:hypothetical protein D9M68_503740 [compost metagenome]